MKTSNNQHTPASPDPAPEHWSELMATLPLEDTDEFGDWLEEELSSFEADHAEFVTPISRKESLRR